MTDSCPTCGRPMIDEDADTELEQPRLAGFERFLTEDQDPNVVEKTLVRVEPLLTRDEEISYIAIQHKPVVNVSPLSVVLTTRRFILFKPGLLGKVDFEDFIWRDLKDARLKEGMMGATLTLTTVDGELLEVDYLPKEQARRAYSIAQQMEEHVEEQRRQRALEEKRAAAGGVVVQAATGGTGGTPADSPVATLKHLKEMVEGGLISPEDYENKKNEILSRM